MDGETERRGWVEGRDGMGQFYEGKVGLGEIGWSVRQGRDGTNRVRRKRTGMKEEGGRTWAGETARRDGEGGEGGEEAERERGEQNVGWRQRQRSSEGTGSGAIEGERSRG